MKFLLLDFGASFVKTSIYDKDSRSLSLFKQYQSPFLTNDKININDIKYFISNIMNDYENFDIVLPCSIKNGFLINDEYVSWKLLDQNRYYEKESIIGAIFKNQSKHHIHNDQDEKSLICDLKELGTFENKIFLSCLGDTECVKRAFDLDDESVLLNLGTGSQIIYRDYIKSFFPSGRMFLVFDKFFSSLGCNFFDELANITLTQILESSLDFDINVFPQSRNFINFGSIGNITESNLNKDNFLASLLKSYIEQYLVKINPLQTKKIFLSGGIPKKLPVIKQYIENKLNVAVIESDSSYPETHLGMVNMIEKYYL